MNNIGSDNYLKISLELNSLKLAQEQTNRDLNSLRAENSQMTAAINKLLLGNGNPEQGLIVRVDRIEQHMESAKFWRRAGLGAGFTALAGNVIQFLLPFLIKKP